MFYYIFGTVLKVVAIYGITLERLYEKGLILYHLGKQKILHWMGHMK